MLTLREQIAEKQIANFPKKSKSLTRDDNINQRWRHPCVRQQKLVSGSGLLKFMSVQQKNVCPSCRKPYYFATKARLVKSMGGENNVWRQFVQNCVTTIVACVVLKQTMEAFSAAPAHRQRESNHRDESPRHNRALSQNVMSERSNIFSPWK